MATVLQIKGEAPWVCWYDQNSKHFIARCDSLSLSASGRTQSEMMAELAEAMQLLFSDLLASGELPQFLQARGWAQESATC